MGFPKPPSPPGIPMPPPAAHPAVLGSSTVASTLQAQKKSAEATKFTADDTIGTSPQGLKTPASTAKATLLGQ